MKLDKLIEVLEGLQPVELKGVALLRERRLQTGNWFPQDDLETKDILESTLELMKYGDACQRVTKRLEDADPIALSVPLAEYPL
jgi:hypothetical protein